MPVPLLFPTIAPGTPSAPIVRPGSGSTTSIVRRPFLHVTVDGVLVPNVFSFTASFGYDLAVSECTIVCPYVPANLNYWSVVGVRAGANPGSAQTRFNGFCVETDYTFSPRDMTIVCRGPLVRAQLVECSTAGGVDLSAGGAGQTDQAMIQQLLSAAGATVGGPIPLNIGGLGRTLGTIAAKYYTWSENQSALDMIQQLDAICLGYRIFDTPGGGIQRQQITASPATSAALTFTEGVDIYSASPQVSILDTKTRVQVTGYDDGSGGGPFGYTIQQSNPLMPLGFVTDQISSNLIESSAIGGTGISAQEVATWWLGQTNRAIGKYTFVTPRDDLIVPGMTIAIRSPLRLGVNQNFWVQHVDISIDEKGVFSQQLIAVAGLLGVPGSGSGGSGISTTPTGGVIGGGDGNGATGGSGSGGGQGTTPTDTGPQVDFSLNVQSEEVLVGGSYTLLYDVQCTSAAVGTSAAITGYAWSCAAGTPTSSTDDTYVFYLSAITGSQTITLTVTDANGLTATISHTLTAPATGQIATRPLYLAGTDCAEMYDGATFHTHSGSGITVVANAGAFGDSAGDVIVSPDNFVTFPTTLSPFSPITALWVESTVNASRILAAGGAGQVAVSNDAGASWIIPEATPSGSNTVLRCIISGSHPNQWFALTAGGLYRTDNAGSGWVIVVAAAAGESFTDVALSFGRNMITMTGGRKMIDFAGTPQVMPAGVGDPIAVTAHIRKDRFYIVDAAGHTAYHAADGATTLTAGTSLPGGTAQPRGLYRDGQIVDLLYVAAGSLVYKSTDGLRTAGGYHVLRQAGVSTAPSGATYTQIGADGTLVVPPVTPTTVVSTAGQGKVLSLWTGSGNTAAPAGWMFPSYDDAAWATAALESHDAAYIPGTSNIWTASPVANREEILHRVSFTLSAGKVTSAVLSIVWDDLGAVYLNGTYLGQMIVAHPSPPTNVYTIPTGLLVQGTNVLAVACTNDNDVSGNIDYKLVIT